MEVKATGKYMKVQPRKVRILADLVRGKNAHQASELLRFHSSKGARFLRKILVSAMANANENNNLSVENLKITRIQIDEGPRLKRIQARAMGRAFRIVKKTSHITVVVEEGEPIGKIKPHGTKAKPRPTLAPSKKTKKAEPKVEEAVAEATPAELETIKAVEVVNVAEVSVEETAPESDATETEIEAVSAEAEEVVEEATESSDATETEIDSVKEEPKEGN
jgi:large subunit ribosomal protein L22